MNSPDEPSSRMQSGGFVTTHWSLVLRGGTRGSKEGDDALAKLCEDYWYPLYAFVRRRVHDVHEAQDLTQGFFARLLEKNALAHAAPERGRFRSFLLAAMQNYLANEWDRGQSQKRGGGRQRFSLDLELGESRLSLEPCHDLTAERIFERQWTLTLLDLVVQRLQSEFAAAGKLRQFELLKGTLTGEGNSIAYPTVAATLGLSEEATRQVAHRLRKRYRELLRVEVSQTVSDPEEVEEEIRRLFETLS